MRFIASVKSGDAINRVSAINILISTPYRGNSVLKSRQLTALFLILILGITNAIYCRTKKSGC